MSRPGYSEAAHREAAKGLVCYAQGERALPVLRRRGAWLKTAEGLIVWFYLIALADDCLSGAIARAQYKQALLQLAPLTTLPREDLEVIARYALEFCRCCFVADGEECHDNCGS